MKKKNNIWCDRAIFVSPVYFGLCTTEAQFREVLLKMSVPQLNWPKFITSDHYDATVHYFERQEMVAAVVCIRIDKARNGIKVAALLVHEAVHIWQEIRQHVGE